MSRFWSALVHRLTPYVPGEQPALRNVVKLNTNEHPFGPSPRALAAIKAATNADLRRYPDPEAMELKRAFARFHHTDPARVFVGNGSDEVLAHCFHALLRHDAPILFPDITYSFYPVYCALYGIAYETIALDETFAVTLDAYRRTNGGIIFANPNAPTGRAIPRAAIASLLEHNTESVVVVDEAYGAFGGESAIPLIDRYPNLLVIRTLSKSHGLAGLRVGAALGDAPLIEGLERVKNSFNSYPLDRLALAGAVAALDDVEYFETMRRRVIDARENLRDALGRLDFTVIPSAANFLFATHARREAAAIAAGLRERGVIVRHFGQPRIANYLRITVGTPEECAALVAALGEILDA